MIKMNIFHKPTAKRRNGRTIIMQNIDQVPRDTDLVLEIQILTGTDHDCITCK